jgi:ADP-ribosylglycohydrolase
MIIGKNNCSTKEVIIHDFLLKSPCFINIELKRGNINEITNNIMNTIDNNNNKQEAGKNMLLGAIAGDMIGSVYEFHGEKKMDFPLFSEESRFTDDTVLSIATMACLLDGKRAYAFYYRSYARAYPHSGFGGMFVRWMYATNPMPYNSWGNGSGMRVSPIGWFFPSLEETLEEAKYSALVTHNHPEGIKGAQAIAAAVFLARTGKSKAEIKAYIETQFGYDLNRTCEEIRPAYSFDVSCQGSVPEAIIAFLDSSDYEHAIRLAVSLGGDSDTIAAMTGGIAEAFYGEIPEHIRKEVWKRLPQEIKGVIQDFACYVQNN